MADYKIFYKKGISIRYFPDEKVLMLQPQKGNKDDFLRVKSQIDTLLQVSGTKRVGNSFTLKLNDTFNVNVDEVLKSLGMKGGIEHEDAQSMVDDSAEDDTKEQEKEQAPEVQAKGNPLPQNQPEMPQLEGVIRKGVFHFLFEEDMFQPGPENKTKKKSKRYGEYWKPIEQFTGKNRNEVKPEDVLDIRKKFSLKPASNDRDTMLQSLDKAANYFYGRLAKIKGDQVAERFHEMYISIDNLKPEDYGADEDEMDTSPGNASIDNGMSLMPDFDGIDYSDINIEKD